MKRALVLIFVLAFVFYTSLDKLPLTHPGNLKASDAFYHTTVVEGILDTQHWDEQPVYVSLGIPGGVNVSPPLLYIQAAVLSLFGKIPSWVSLYFLVSLFAVLAGLLAYLIGIEAFGDEDAALLGAVAALFPIPVKVWLYQVYVGFWIQVVAYCFILGFILAVFKYSKTGLRKWLWFASVCVSAVILSHPQDLLFLFIPFSLFAWFVWKRKENYASCAHNMSLLVGLPLFSFILMLPRFLFVWSSSGFVKVGWQGLREMYFTRQYLFGLTSPDLFFFPWWVLFLIMVGIGLLLMRWRQHKLWLFLTGYFLLTMYVLPLFLADAYYLSGRTRFLTPFILLPVAAYAATQLLIRPLARAFNFSSFYLVLLLASAMIVAGFVSASALRPDLAGELIGVDAWQGYLWVQDHVPRDAKVLMIVGGEQNSGIILKRNTALVAQPVFQENMAAIYENRTIPKEWPVEWAAETLRHKRHRYSTEGFFLFRQMTQYEEWNKTVSVAEVDAIMLENVAPVVAEVNRVIFEELTKQDFKIGFQNGRIMVLIRKATQ